MESIKISSIDFSSLRPLGKFIQIRFEAYYSGEEEGYDDDGFACPTFTVDTETNCVVKRVESEKIRFAYLEDFGVLYLHPESAYSKEYDGDFYISGLKNDQEWSVSRSHYDGMVNTDGILSNDEIKLLADLFSDAKIYVLLQELLDKINELS